MERLSGFIQRLGFTILLGFNIIYCSDSVGNETCSQTEFTCNTTKFCISRFYICNGHVDCGIGDTSDEENCASCSNSFHCNSTNICLPYPFRCDGSNDCGEGDFSDEINCGSCPNDLFQCKTGRCLKLRKRCNGVYDCENGDTSDEDNCASCSTDQFHCTESKTCIPKEKRCDALYSCGNLDFSDEQNCEFCNENAFHCNTTNTCIESHSRCDGLPDCGNYVESSDEENCDKCRGRSVFRCLNGQCLNADFVCDEDEDCKDGSDEKGCINTDKCKWDEFKCLNGKCIMNSGNQCNGDNDCGDWSDENFCEFENCIGFWCNASSKCLSVNQTCDFTFDCEDLSDEDNCPAELQLSYKEERITTALYNQAVWNFNITSNRNFTIMWKTPNENDVIFGTKKFKKYITEYKPMHYGISLEINDIGWNDEGLYPLLVNIYNEKNLSKSLNFHLTVEDPTSPRFLFTNMDNSSISLVQGIPQELICNATGHPKTAVIWFWNSLPRNSWPASLKYSMYQGNQILLIQSVPSEEPNQFMCIAQNANGYVSAFAKITVVRPGDTFLLKVGVLGAFLSVLAIAVGALALRYRWQQKELYNLLNVVSTDNPEDKKYDRNLWEISRHNLELGIPLGIGTFGIVFKARATGVIEGEESTIVAVKRAKDNADVNHLKSLITELKIMASLGNHSNIVRLIGACAKNLTNKKLLLVMEFCQYGNLQRYMVLKRKSFVNQLDPVTDEIDPLINNTNDKNLKAATKEADSNNDYVEKVGNINLENYTEDYEISETKAIRTMDLLSWAFQVAKGMDYLSNKNIFHGDLAARNVLLAENNVAKISDFGFSREILKSYDYKKDIKGILLPTKWMAIESIYNGIFSSKSDCWAYGVFLWELFTLGAKPYPELEVNEEFRESLYQGYRMAKPEYAPTYMYKLMMDCWLHEAIDRPTFSKVCTILEDIIAGAEKKRFHLLNGEYACVIDDNIF